VTIVVPITPQMHCFIILWNIVSSGINKLQDKPIQKLAAPHFTMHLKCDEIFNNCR